MNNAFKIEVGGRWKSSELVVLFALILLATATRIYGIWEWTLNGDEFYTVTYARERASGWTNQAYYALVVASTNLFGLSEWSARLPSVLISILSIPVFYICCRSFLDRKTATIGALFIIFCDWHLQLSQMSRFYSGVFFFGIISYFVFYAAIAKNSFWLLAGALLSQIAGILFQTTSVLVPAACGTFALFVILFTKSGSSPYSKRIAITYLFFWAALALAAMPILIGTWSTWSSQKQNWEFYSLRELLSLVNNVGIGLIVASLFGLVAMLRDDRHKAIFIGCGIGVPLLLWLMGSVLLPNVRDRYVFYALPLIFVCAAYLCMKVYESLSQYRIARSAFVLVIIAGMMPGFVSYYTGKMTLDVSDAVSVIQQGYKKGDVIIVTGPPTRHLVVEAIPGATVRVGANVNHWNKVLSSLEGEEPRTWILLERYRNVELSPSIETWLIENAKMVWRKYEKSFSYSMLGYELYLVDRSYDHSRIFDIHMSPITNNN